jgi:methyl-accepting chemotaxis protein
MASNEPKIQKIQTHFQALSQIASSLNAASDELTKTVSILDESLKKLNVGLNAWVTFRTRGEDDQPQLYDLDQIGYSKVNGVWGIALRRIWGDESTDQHSGDGPWLFNDAPREMRLLSVDKIPEVIEELAKVASNITKKIQEKTKQVRELAEAIKGKSPSLADRVAAGHATLVTNALKDAIERAK